jgi:hypothetical protein
MLLKVLALVRSSFSVAAVVVPLLAWALDL